MPEHKVIAPGFANGRFYGGNSRRQTIVTDKPYSEKNPKPSWVGDEVQPTVSPKVEDIPPPNAVEIKDIQDVEFDVAPSGPPEVRQAVVPDFSSDVGNSEEAQADTPDNEVVETL